MYKYRSQYNNPYLSENIFNTKNKTRKIPAAKSRIDEIILSEPKKTRIILKKETLEKKGRKLSDVEQKIYEIENREYQKKYRSWEDRLIAHGISKEQRESSKTRKNPHLFNDRSILLEKPKNKLIDNKVLPNLNILSTPSDSSLENELIPSPLENLRGEADFNGATVSPSSSDSSISSKSSVSNTSPTLNDTPDPSVSQLQPLTVTSESSVSPPQPFTVTSESSVSPPQPFTVTPEYSVSPPQPFTETPNSSVSLPKLYVSPDSSVSPRLSVSPDSSVSSLSPFNIDTEPSIEKSTTPISTDSEEEILPISTTIPIIESIQSKVIPSQSSSEEIEKQSIDTKSLSTTKSMTPISEDSYLKTIEQETEENEAEGQSLAAEQIAKEKEAEGQPLDYEQTTKEEEAEGQPLDYEQTTKEEEAEGQPLDYEQTTKEEEAEGQPLDYEQTTKEEEVERQRIANEEANKLKRMEEEKINIMTQQMYKEDERIPETDICYYISKIKITNNELESIISIDRIRYINSFINYINTVPVDFNYKPEYTQCYLIEPFKNGQYQPILISVEIDKYINRLIFYNGNIDINK